jgi:two-component system, OmpR family, alkaline phosphatase synthesis response regulator PhoP
MAKRCILVVEDDAAIRRGVVDALTFDGYDVRSARDGHEGLELALRVPCDLVLLDLVMPGPGGLEILQALRGSRPTMPVIILTARGGESDRVAGLRLGADDYVVKPFSVRELLARVEAVLRRSAERPADLLEVCFPGGRADLDRRTLHYDDSTQAELSAREAELLRYLAIHPGRILSREELLERVWRLNPRAVETRTVDVHIARLRAKLRDDAGTPRVLTTVRGKGYVFEPGPASVRGAE